MARDPRERRGVPTFSEAFPSREFVPPPSSWVSICMGGVFFRRWNTRDARNGGPRRSKPYHTTPPPGFDLGFLFPNRTIRWAHHWENKKKIRHPDQSFPVQRGAFNEPDSAGSCRSCCTPTCRQDSRLGPEIKSFKADTVAAPLRVGHRPHPSYTKKYFWR